MVRRAPGADMDGIGREKHPPSGLTRSSRGGLATGRASVGGSLRGRHVAVFQSVARDHGQRQPFGGMRGAGVPTDAPPLPPPPSYGLRGGEHAEINRNKGKTLARVTYCQVKRHLLSGRWGRELPHPGPPGPPGPFRAGDDHPLRPFAMHRHKPPALSRKPLKCLVCPKPPLPPRAAIRTAIRKGHGD